MTALVTLQQAKDQLSITHGDQDAFIQTKIDESTALVLKYADLAAAAALADSWTTATVPADVRSAILDGVVHLYSGNRGDQDAPALPSPYDAFPTPLMRGKLARWTSLVVA